MTVEASATMEATEAKDFYQAHFRRLESELARNWQARMQPMRREAISSFAKLGFPTMRHEEWKYTNVAPLVQIPFKPAAHGLNGLTSETLARLPFGNLAPGQLVFVNGYYTQELSSPQEFPEGVDAGSLAAALDGRPQFLEPYLGRYASYQDHAFVALNTAFMSDGAFVYIPSGKSMETPIYLLFVSSANGETIASYPRNLIVVGSGSRVTIVEIYAGLKSEVYLTNAVTEIVVGENAVAEHYKLQWENEEAFHVATLQVHQDRSSNFVSHSIALGGALVRNDINTVLDGEGAECTLNGLYIASGQQHVDNHTRIDHIKPHGTSRELYKGVLDERARGVFNGKIYVHKAAQKTDARQVNKNLLRSRDASVDTKPQLEIYNNDVKCSHGSTIGQIDQDALFYLRSRGIGLEAARDLLTYAFASDVISRLKIEPIRAHLDDLLLTRFHKDSQTQDVL